MPRSVGKINQKVIDILGLSIKADTAILLGESNIEHMKSQHPVDFEKYFDKLEDILATPDYVAKHPNDGSIQYIKTFEAHVLIGVRVSRKGALFARTIFEMSAEKVERYRKRDALKKY